MDLVTVSKRGQVRISVSLDRKPSGLFVNVRALPDVEEFMRRLGGGEIIPVSASGRYWIPVEGPLQAYALSQPVEPLRTDDGAVISIDLLGHPLVTERSGSIILNLSCLRLVGISEGAGVSFSLKEVASLTKMRKQTELLARGAQRFYNEYIRPIDMTVQVSVQELQL